MPSTAHYNALFLLLDYLLGESLSPLIASNNTRHEVFLPPSSLSAERYRCGNTIRALQPPALLNFFFFNGASARSWAVAYLTAGDSKQQCLYEVTPTPASRTDEFHLNPNLGQRVAGTRGPPSSYSVAGMIPVHSLHSRERQFHY